MKSGVADALISAASGTVVFALNPEIATGVTAGHELFKLGREVRSQLIATDSRGRAALARIRKRVRADFAAWSSSEGLAITTEMAVADDLLATHLPEVMVDRARIAAAARSPDGLVEAGAALLLEELAARAPFFAVRSDGTARAYAHTVIRFALAAVLTERAYFEALEPHLLLDLVQASEVIQTALGGLDQKVSWILERLEHTGGRRAIGKAELEGILHAFDVAGVDEEEAVAAIIDKANEYRDLKARISRTVDAAAKISLQAVQAALDAGALNEAERLLHSLINRAEDREDRSIRVTLDILEYHAVLASFMLRHDIAAQAYFQASAVASSVNGPKSFHYTLKQADELTQHALRSTDVRNYQAVVSLFGSIVSNFKPGGAAHAEAVGHLVSAMGQLGERLDLLQAEHLLALMIQFSETAKETGCATDYPEAWSCLQSDIAALENNLASRSSKETGRAHTVDAESRLREALALSEAGDFANLGTVRTNLATTLRGLALHHRDVKLLHEAVALRTLALTTLTEEDYRGIANAHDSLGNDQKALMSLQSDGARVAAVKAMMAYRVALRTRARAGFVLDVSRSHRNVAGLYMMLAETAAGREQLKVSRLARLHLQKSLPSLSPDKAPGDWASATGMWIFASLFVHEQSSLSTEDLAGLAQVVADRLAFALAGGDPDLLLDTTTDVIRMVAVALHTGSSGLVDSLARYEALLEKSTNLFAFTPVALHAEFWTLQTRFARACLEGRFADAAEIRSEIATKVAGVAPEVGGEISDLGSLLPELDAAYARLRSFASQTTT